MKKISLYLKATTRKLGIISIITLFAFYQTAFAQQGDIPVEVFAGHRAFAHQMYMTKYLDSTSRFGYFGYLRYETPYSDRNKSSFTGQSLFFYDIAKGVSLAGGGYVTNTGFMPQIAIAYSYNVGDLSLTAFGSFEPVHSPNSELFVLMSYSPRLNTQGTWRLFTQFIGSYNFNYDNRLRYNFANQYIRAGVSHKGWQFGLGTDLLQVSGTGSLPANYGLFLRRLL
ncbi:hypothetical protein [Chitinophaga pinensis]|uniref:Type IX secretion system membrane protein PorP/SprF n=1 Tax=Chitinophaga pinensis (strain ATCC 43595 / DSM 2588 / LMG 13176 / NBRC 15968 / NCIMB 11800 / UQM 2034) TaxID=485918 RepID=A0A979G3D5_CHIPD|nr:hypothetical protein [Chitinophaga pinensis]ACU59996.1 hypothetical protein Cpin_2508 [Chitinophaga pinensis DSM 2588]